MLLGMLSPWEILVVAGIILLVLGPKKLPQLGSSVGKMLRGFKKEMREIAEEDHQNPEVDVTPVEPSASKDA